MRTIGFYEMLDWQQAARAPFRSLEGSFPCLKARTLNGSLLPGTSKLGFALKKEVGLNETTRCSTGMLLRNVRDENGRIKKSMHTQANLPASVYEWSL